MVNVSRAFLCSGSGLGWTRNTPNSEIGSSGCTRSDLGSCSQNPGAVLKNPSTTQAFKIFTENCIYTLQRKILLLHTDR